MISKLIQAVLGFVLPLVVASAWVMIAMQGGMQIWGEPTPEQERWQLASIAMGIVGYLALVIACVLLRKRWPVFAVTGGVFTLLFAMIQLVDLLD